LQTALNNDALADMHTLNPGLPASKRIASRQPLVIGHRGYCAVAPENTLPSFKLALEAGADLVELDYRHSQDGLPVVFHDETLDRTTDARKKWNRRRIKVAEKTASEIRSLDAGSWFDATFAGTKVPLLTEALDLICGRGGVALIEHKSGDAESCVGLLRKRNRIDQVVVISFDWACLHAIHKLEPNLALGALGPPARLVNGRKPSGLLRSLSARWLDELAKTGAKAAVWNRHVSARAIRLAHKRGLKVWVYTVNTSRLARRLLGIGADGIITNRTSLIRQTLEGRRAGR
jgi:glycerophosphoryl diester phosphodiesterase